MKVRIMLLYGVVGDILMLSVLLAFHTTPIMLPLPHGIRLYNCMILLLEYTGMYKNKFRVTHNTVYCRNGGPTILRHHEGSVSSCAFSRDGTVTV